MAEFIADFTIDILKDKLRNTRLDYIELQEDMAYKHAPMISPTMFRKFLAPHYRRVIDFLKRNGVRLVYVDCDGDPGGLISEWINVGVDGMSPVEIAAGCDPLSIRKMYPRFFMMGGIDKRVITMRKIDIYSEVMNKVPVLLEQGGFIPHIDHAIPHDIPLLNYMYYRELLTRVVYGECVFPPGDPD